MVEKLNSYSSKEFFLSLFSTSNLTQRIRKERLQPIVDWMNTHDVAVVATSKAPEYSKEFVLQPDGGDEYHLEVSLIPATSEFRREADVLSRELVGISSLGGARSGPIDHGLRERIREKRKRYDPSVLDAPLLIAVNTIAHVPRMDWALYGTPTATIHLDKSMGGIVAVSESMSKDGIWLMSEKGKDRLRASHLLGVWNFVLAHPSNPSPTACLYTNPYVDWSEVKPGFPIWAVFRLKGQPKRDSGIIFGSCKASQSPVYPIRDAILAVNHVSCPSLSSSGPREWGESALKTSRLPGALSLLARSWLYPPSAWRRR